MTAQDTEQKTIVHRIFVEGSGYWTGWNFTESHSGWKGERIFKDKLDDLYDRYLNLGLPCPKVEIHKTIVVKVECPIEVDVLTPEREEYLRARRWMFERGYRDFCVTDAFRMLEKAVSSKRYKWILFAEARGEDVKLRGTLIRYFETLVPVPGNGPLLKTTKRFAIAAARTEADLVILTVALGNSVGEPIRLWPDLPQ